MALSRTNMVSLLDIGSLNGGATANIVELGDGFNEITEDWAPEIEGTQYVNMDAKSNTLKGYDFSTELEREHISDAVQTAINNLFKTFPTGSKCETFYYRFYKSDITSNAGACIKVPVIVAPSSTGGAGGDILKSSIQIKGNGDVIPGTITITVAEGVTTYAFVATA